MPRILYPALFVAAALLSGCATTPRPGPVNVTRYHLGAPAAGDSVSVQPLTVYAGVSPEDQIYVDAVAGELGRLGYVPTARDAPSTYIAAVSYKHVSRGFVRKPPPVTIGVGGGTYGGNVGVGAGGSFGIGGGRVEVIADELSVQIKRRADNSVLWEGRAITEGPVQPGGVTAGRLANALFRGFPGESGITITVK